MDSVNVAVFHGFRSGIYWPSAQKVNTKSANGFNFNANDQIKVISLIPKLEAQLPSISMG